MALHGAIQGFYEARLRGDTMTEAELKARLDELWNDKGYASREAADEAQARAHTAITAFATRERQREQVVIASELPISLELPEAKLRLRGRIDATFQLGNGVEIRDFKTGRKTDPEKLAKDAKENFQLRTYALAYEMMTGAAPAAVTLDYVVTGIEGSAQLSPAILLNWRKKLGMLAEEIRARNFAAKPSTVHQCAAIRYYGTGDDE